MLKKDVAFKFGPEELESFEKIKEKLIASPILAIYNHKHETELHCDASALGFGAILMQRKADLKFHPVFYFSKRTTNTECKYHSFELETLAIIYALRRFRVYLQGIPFKIVTDCESLKLTLNKKEVNPRIARWALELQDYDYSIEHRIGSKMRHVDALSRNNGIMILEDNPFEQNLIISQSTDKKIQELCDKLEKTEDSQFELRNGILYRKRTRLLFYVPSSMEKNVLFRYHDEFGHLGFDKTRENIVQNYWFPNLTEKIKIHIQNCLKCIAFSPPAGCKEGFVHSIPKGKVPFNVIHIDYYGPVDKTQKIKQHVLVVVDAFTKYVKLYATRGTTSTETIRFLTDYFINFSRPNIIISDRGTCFTSMSFIILCKIMISNTY